MSLVTLLLLVGLSIDGLRVYIAYGQGQRAAEAAALGGVIYLPQYATSANPAPDGSDATDRAIQIAGQNGFTNPSDITVTPVMGSVPMLRVTIHVQVVLSLIALLNPHAFSATPSATAEVLPPIALGDASGSFGDLPESVTQQYAGLTSPFELKERGDPYSVQCESGWSDGSDGAHADANSSVYFTQILHVATNAPQYPGGPNCSPGSPGNPDQISAGFGGLATRSGLVPTGASYLITLPAGGSGYSVWVWNPRFVYATSSLTSQLFTTENIYSGLFTDNPSFYPQMAYSLFTVPEIYNRAADVPLAAIWPYATAPNTAPDAPLNPSQVTTLPALDTNFWDLLAHGCPFGGAWTVGGGNTYTGGILSGQGCLSSIPADVGQWVQLGTTPLAGATSSPAYLRLTADTNAGYGQHAYAVKVCHNASVATGCSAGGATVAAWNAETVMLQGATTQTYPLATIPAAFAGQQISVRLYNPGASSGTVALAIVLPATGGTVSYPAWERMTTIGALQAIQTSLAGDRFYHGKWVQATLTLPTDYAGGAWTLEWSGTVAPSSRLMTISATLVGKPVGLVG